jgi:hypothetical protein
MTANWIQDAQAWFSSRLTQDTSDAERAEMLRAVKPVRDAICAYEQRYLHLMTLPPLSSSALKGGEA